VSEQGLGDGGAAMREGIWTCPPGLKGSRAQGRQERPVLYVGPLPSKSGLFHFR
jgi:hypothetical protein